MIGDIFYMRIDDFAMCSKIVKAFKKDEFDIFELKSRPQEIIVLNNGSLIVAGWEDDFILTLYDQDFKVIKTTNEINGKLIQPTGLAVNTLTNQLFISDIDEHQIIITDFEFNKLNAFGSRGSNNEQFSFPAGLCFLRNSDLYVCDDGNKRIQIFSKELEFMKTIPLDYHPRRIKVSNTTAFIRGYTSGNINVFFKTYIYDLTNWTLKSNYDHHSYYSCICDLYNYYYIIPFNSKLILYNSEGDKLKEAEVKIINEISDFDPVGLINLKNNLIIYSQDKRCIRLKL